LLDKLRTSGAATAIKPTKTKAQVYILFPAKRPRAASGKLLLLKESQFDIKLNLKYVSVRSEDFFFFF
jgi:hypothetical protein